MQPNLVSNDTMKIKFHFRYIQQKLRTPSGRPIVLLNIDATDIKVEKSADAFLQMSTYSGERNKGHCLLFSNVTDSSGSIVAVTPGPNISCTPRGGDGVSLGVHMARAEEIARTTGTRTGFDKLLRGTLRLGVGLVMDRGYVYRPNVNTGSNPSVLEYCQNNDILSIFRPNRGEPVFLYNNRTQLLEKVNASDDTKSANTGRLATLLRAASENAHLFKMQYKSISNKQHNSRLKAIGAEKIAHYNNRFNKDLGIEWREVPRINVDYIVTVRLYNRFSAKFKR